MSVTAVHSSALGLVAATVDSTGFDAETETGIVTATGAFVGAFVGATVANVPVVVALSSGGLAAPTAVVLPVYLFHQ